MNRYLIAIFWGSLFYVEYRWGLTLNRFFIVVFLISSVISAYHSLWLIGSLLVSLKSSKLLFNPLQHYRRKLIVWLAIATFSFYGFYRTQIPGQLEAYEAVAKAKFEEIVRGQETEKSERKEGRKLMEMEIKTEEKRIDETSLRARRTEKHAEGSKEMIAEITTGWNKETADTENDNINWEKATDLIKKYPNYIRRARENKIKASQALEAPQEYYGKVVSFRGQIYSIQQLPPENSVAQFFDGNCYHAMMVVNDNNKPVAISVYIVGNAESVAENSVVNVKGFIYGQSQLVNSLGGVSNGIAFVGFQE